jgi:hypothetical protein
MIDRAICDLCGRTLAPHAHYIVKMEIFADPAMPPVSSEELEELDLDRTMAELMEQIKGLSADDLQDQVHRGFEFKVCRACQMRLLANPLGKPRGEQKLGHN